MYNTKKPQSSLIYIDFNQFQNYNLGGTIVASIMENQIGSELSFKTANSFYVRTIFNIIQKWIEEGLILAGHDISDGGLITTLIEMAITSNIGLDVYLGENLLLDSSILKALFLRKPRYCLPNRKP